jgi:hypothetical protein
MEEYQFYRKHAEETEQENDKLRQELLMLKAKLSNNSIANVYNQNQMEQSTIKNKKSSNSKHSYDDILDKENFITGNNTYKREPENVIYIYFILNNF